MFNYFFGRSTATQQRTQSPPPTPSAAPILTKTLDSALTSIPPEVIAVAAFSIGAATSIASFVVVRRYVRRIPNADWITPDILAKKRWLKGRVVSVGDADNFRLYHTPGLGWGWPLKIRHVPETSKELQGQTIHVRLAGVDAPEGGHFGRDKQPYFAEALAWLKSRVEGRTVYCQVIQKDQYARVVCVPHLKPRFLPGALFKGPSLAIEMLRAGWAVTYQQAGAVYEPWTKEDFLRVEKEAFDARRGMWKNGQLAETPAEYKKRHASTSKAGTDVVPDPILKPTRRPKQGWLRRLWLVLSPATR